MTYNLCSPAIDANAIISFNLCWSMTVCVCLQGEMYEGDVFEGEAGFLFL